MKLGRPLPKASYTQRPEVVTFKHKLFQGAGADGVQAGQEAEDDAAAKALASEQEKIVKQKR